MSENRAKAVRVAQFGRALPVAVVVAGSNPASLRAVAQPGQSATGQRSQVQILPRIVWGMEGFGDASNIYLCHVRRCVSIHP